MDKAPFANYKKRYKKTERSFLTERELRLIEETTFWGRGHERVKDTFLFSCYTRLAYGDVKALEVDHMRFGIDRNLWIHTKKEKTYETVKVPFQKKAKIILDKYKECNERLIHGKLLPVLSNQKTNSYLK